MYFQKIFSDNSLCTVIVLNLKLYLGKTAAWKLDYLLLRKNIHPIMQCTADHMMISGLQSHKELFLDDEEMYSYVLPNITVIHSSVYHSENSYYFDFSSKWKNLTLAL